MSKSPVRIEEHNAGRVVSFYANCPGPEAAAWDLLRAWVTGHIKDYPARRYLGCAPKGHHTEGETHQAGEEIGKHEYLAQMILFSDEGQGSNFLGAEVQAGPQGLYLVGDVPLTSEQPDGSVDIGSAMQKAYATMTEHMRAFEIYEYAFEDRPYYEEHIFSGEWYAGQGDLAGFKLWLPIRKVQRP